MNKIVINREMKRVMRSFFYLLMIFTSLFFQSQSVLAASLKAKANALISAYPSVIKSFDGRYLYFKDGTKLRFDDGKRKTAQSRLNNPDIEDMFYGYYRFGGHARAPRYLSDPGRARNQPLMYKLYGRCDYSKPCHKGTVIECQAKGKLVRIPWLKKFGGKTLTVTTRFGIAQKLVRISKELENLPASSFKNYLVPSSGAYYKRCIAGTNRLSVHSFGAAVDIRYNGKDYWKHSGKQKGAVCTALGYPASGCYIYRKTMPSKIIRIFEKYGFIWGGNWYHFDAFHFEYRPEFLALRRQGDQASGQRQWLYSREIRAKFRRILRLEFLARQLTNNGFG